MASSVRPIVAAGLTALAGSLFPLHAADGDLDTDFGGGTVTLNWMAASIATELLGAPDGDLLVGGVRGTDPPGGTPLQWVVARFDPNGDVDDGWDQAFVGFDFEDESVTVDTRGLFDMAFDAEGRLLLAGSVETVDGEGRPAMARLLPTGELDPAFDGNGLDILTGVDSGWTQVRVRDAKFLPDGRSVFVGSCEDCPTEGLDTVWVTRRLANGQPDATFSGDGWMTFQPDLESGASAHEVELYEDGRILVGGGIVVVVANKSYLARVTAAGNLDSAFGGGDGISETFGSGIARATRDLAIDPDSGRIAVAVSTHSPPVEGMVYAFTAAGVPDTGFSGDGWIYLDREEGASVESVEFQSDGRLLAAGRIDANGTPVGGFFLARLTTAGELDTTYDGNGVKRVEFDVEGNADDVALVVRPIGGKLVAAGYAEFDAAANREMAVLRTESALIFTDGFERQSVGGWLGN